MKKISLGRLLSLSALLIIFLLFPNKAAAEITATQNPNPADINTGSITFTLKLTGNDLTAASGNNYVFGFWQDSAPDEGSGFCNSGKYNDMERQKKVDSSGNLSATFTLTGNNHTKGNWIYKVWQGQGCSDYNKNSIIYRGSFTISIPSTSLGQAAITTQNGCSNFANNSVQNFFIQNVLANTSYKFWIDGQSTTSQTFTQDQIDNSSGVPTATVSMNVGGTGEKKACLTLGNNTGCDSSVPLSISAGVPLTCTPAQQSNQPGFNPTFTEETPDPDAPPQPCMAGTTESGTQITINKDDFPAVQLYKLKQIKNCTAVATAFGSMGTNPASFIRSIFSLLLGISGGIALLLIIMSGYSIMTSQGDEEKIKEARERLTSAIVGLLFIILSFVILQIIGVDILKIPGFGA